MLGLCDQRNCLHCLVLDCNLFSVCEAKSSVIPLHGPCVPVIDLVHVSHSGIPI